MAKRKIELERKCLICNKTFKPRYKANVYCSRECQYKSMKKNRGEFKCVLCGNTFTPKRNDVKNLYCSLRCSSKVNGKKNIKIAKQAQLDQFKLIREEKVKEKENNQKLKLINKLVALLRGIPERDIRKLIKVLKRKQECAYCGKEFISINNRKYCSKKCSEKKHNHNKAIKRNKKINNNGDVDNTITLDKLIVRDNCICQLCGKSIDINDYSIVDNCFIAGNNYPSIDHIKPIAKGGKHQWSNVQLAHRICNSIKSDRE